MPQGFIRFSEFGESTEFNENFTQFMKNSIVFKILFS